MKNISFIAILATLAITAGCASRGDLKQHSAVMPDGETILVEDYDQMVPDWGVATGNMELNVMVKIPKGQPVAVTAKQRAAIKAAEELCRDVTKDIRADGASIAAQAGLIGVAGYAAGSWAAHAIPHAVASQQAQFIGRELAVVNAAAGAINTGSKGYTFDTCGQNAFSLSPQYGVRVLQK